MPVSTYQIISCVASLIASNNPKIEIHSIPGSLAEAIQTATLDKMMYPERRFWVQDAQGGELEILG